MVGRLCLIASLAIPVPAFAQDEDAGASAATKKELDVSRLPFTPDSIKMVMEEAQPQIQGCYEEMLAGSRKPVEGKLMTHFVITPEGKVKSAKVARSGTSLKDAKLHQCVVEVLKALAFPQPPDGNNYPIEFPFNLKAVK